MMTIDHATLIVVLAEMVMVSLGWGVCMWINLRQGSVYYNFGNILFALSYIPTIWRCHLLWINRIDLELFNWLTIATMTMQLSGVSYFIMAYFYNKSKIKKGF